MSRNPETVLAMPSTLKLALSLTAVSAILIGSMFAAEQTEARHQQTNRLVLESTADLNDKAAAESDEAG